MPNCPLSPRVARLLDQGEDEGLEDHLAGCPDCQQAVVAAAGELCVPPTQAAGDEPPARLLGRLRELANEVAPEGEPPAIPGFEVIGVLGRGGSAVVYKARQVALNRVVALKVLSAGQGARPESLARGRRGVEALAALDHPGIVRVFHAGEHEGLYYAAQEYVEGGTLADAMADGFTFEPAFAARLVRDLARAAQALHERGLVHRDIKPSNVLLSVSGATPKLADFGLARAIDEGCEWSGEGVVVGTPGAMAPEQAEGRPRLGPPADVWALGVILYQMLTGRPPFDAESTTELLGRAAAAAPEPPSRLAVNVPAELERVCLTCLRKDPRDRYQTAAALADDLGRFLQDKPRARRRPPLSSWGIWAGVFLVAMLLAVGVIADRLAARVEEREQAIHHLRLDLARERLERGDRAGAWEILDRCPEPRRDQAWRDLWQRSQPRD